MSANEISQILALERKALVLTALQSRIGVARGMHEAELVAITLLNGRICRKAIELLRLDGVQICGKPETGYYIAATADELNQTTDWMFKRAAKTLKQISRMKKIALPALVGQINLDD